MNTRKQVTILTAIALIAITLSMAFISNVNSVPPPIGSTAQIDPYDSLPTAFARDPRLYPYVDPDVDLPTMGDGDFSTGVSWRIGFPAYTIRPIGDDFTGLTPWNLVYPTTPTTHFDKVDDVASDSDATYIKITTTGTKEDRFTLEDPIDPIGNPISVNISARVKRMSTPAGTGTIKLSMWLGTNSIYSTTGVSLTTSYALVTLKSATKPGGGSWTWTDINNLRIGVQFTSTTGTSWDVRCTQVWADVVADGDTPHYVEASAFANYPVEAFSIGWVDMKINYNEPMGLVQGQYRIVYQVAPDTTWLTLQDWTKASFNYDGLQYTRAWSKVTEPNNGVWEWEDLPNVYVRVECQRGAAGEDLGNPSISIYDIWLTVYKGTYPTGGPGVTMFPQNLTALGQGSTFFEDIYISDVTKMHGFGFVVRYNPYVLTALDYFAYNPFISKSPSEVSEWTYLYVRYFDNVRAGWIGVGSTPFVNKIDYPTNYIYSTTDGDTIGDFFFSSTTSANLGRTAYIELNAQGDGDDQIEIWLNDGTLGGPWIKVDTITPPAAPGIDWVSSVDVGQILNTLDKINSAKVYLVKKTVLDEGEVDVDAMRLRLASGYAAVSFSSFMGDNNGFTGTGPAVRIYFSVDVEAMSPLHFDKATLSDVFGYAITTNYVNDGLYIGPRWLSAIDNPATRNPIQIPVGPGPSDPIGTKWHEIFPQYSRTSVMTSWIDNGDGYLSASDQIDMTYDDDPGKLQFYHVDTVTTTIHWTFKPDEVTVDPKKPGAAEPETPTTELPIDPIGSRWHQIYPPGDFCRLFTITSWADNGNGHFDPSDQFDFEYDDLPGILQYAHLDAVSTDILLTWKYETGAVPEFPLGIGIVLALAPIIPLVYIRRLRKNKELKQ